MSALSFLLNVLWIVCGGLWMSVAWIVAAILMAVTIVGLLCAAVLASGVMSASAMVRIASATGRSLLDRKMALRNV
jgi:uncharacterized membrane protein YccF (DUF307 family)